MTQFSLQPHGGTRGTRAPAEATTALNVTLGENPAAFNSFNTYLPGFVDGITYNTGQPKAYLNYILFDANYANPQYGYKTLTITAASGWEKLSLPAITAPYNGFAYIYLTNESNYNVYFDDFTIIHEKNTKSLRVTESTDYYPYGLPIEGTRYIDESRLVNSYGYQGDYAEFDKRTGWNRFALRGNYDARLGRWMSADPYNQFASPYLSMGNSPSGSVDPSGGITFPWPKLPFTILDPVTVTAPRWGSSAVPGLPAWASVAGTAGGAIAAQLFGQFTADNRVYNINNPNIPNKNPYDLMRVTNRSLQYNAPSISQVYQSPSFNFNVEWQQPAPPAQFRGGDLGEIVRQGTAPWGEAITEILISLPASEYVLGKVLFSAVPAIFRAGKIATRSLDDLATLRGAKWSEIENLIPKDWIRKPLNKGKGVKYVNPNKRGEQILLEKGWSNSKDPLHSGPYIKVSKNGKVERIPLKGNSVLKTK